MASTRSVQLRTQLEQPGAGSGHRGRPLLRMLAGGCLVLWMSVLPGAQAAGAINNPEALKKTKDILAAFRVEDPQKRLPPERGWPTLAPLWGLLPQLSDRNQAVYPMKIGLAVLETERRWAEEALGPVGTFFPKRGGSSMGESLLFDGIAVAAAHDLDCLAVSGYVQLVYDVLTRNPADPELAAYYLEAAAEPALSCDTHNPDSYDPGIWDARARLSFLWSSLYRQEGDRAAQLEALQATVALADPQSDLREDSQLRLLELRQDLGDITFGVERYEPFVKAERFHTRANARICQASLALDRGEPDAAVASLDALEQDPQLLSDPQMVTMIHAYRARAAIKREPPALDVARLELALAEESRLGVTLLARQGISLTQVEGEVALMAGELDHAERAFTTVLNEGEEEHELVWRARLGLAEVCLKLDRLMEARGHLLSGLEVLESLRTATALEFWDRPYLCQAQKVFDRLITTLLKQGVRDRGQAQGGALLDPRTLEPTPDSLLALVAKQSSLSFAVALMHESVADTEEKAELMRSLGAMNSGELVPGERLRQSLDPRQVVYLYYPLPEQVLILEVRREAVRAYPVPFADADRAAVRALLRALRGAPAGVPEELDRLGARLLSPIWNTLPTEDGLAGFILLGELEKLPLPALRVEGRYLVERTTPYELPFLQALPLLPSPSAERREKALVVSAGDDLPFAAEQDGLVKASGFDVTSLSEPNDGELSMALEEPFGLVVIGSHAQAPSSTVLERTSGAVAFRAGAEAALLLEDGQRFPASRLRECRFQGAQVILSACETRVGDARVLDHSQGALHRAVLEAGAASVTASRWKVGDRATYALLAHLLPKAREVGMARALAWAQRRLLEGQGQAVLEVARARLEERPARPGEPSLNAPWSWAGFTVIGRPE